MQCNGMCELETKTTEGDVRKHNQIHVMHLQQGTHRKQGIWDSKDTLDGHDRVSNVMIQKGEGSRMI